MMLYSICQHFYMYWYPQAPLMAFLTCPRCFFGLQFLKKTNMHPQIKDLDRNIHFYSYFMIMHIRESTIQTRSAKVISPGGNTPVRHSTQLPIQAQPHNPPGTFCGRSGMGWGIPIGSTSREYLPIYTYIYIHINIYIKYIYILIIINQYILLVLIYSLSDIPLLYVYIYIYIYIGRYSYWYSLLDSTQSPIQAQPHSHPGTFCGRSGMGWG